MKAIIYVRTSTFEQHPEKQLADCREFAKARGYEIVEEAMEQVSAFKKDVTRPVYESIKSKAHAGEVQAVIVWRLDRWVRNRDTLLEDVTYLRGCGVKLHSVREQWLEAINIEGALGRTLQDFLLGLVGSLAEMESSTKSDRVKMAFKNHKGTWGRKSLPARVIKEIRDYHAAGKSLRWISQNVFYYDKNNNKKLVSLGSVHKSINNIS